jgi:Ser/Thr protein kinase RdoA (MazF antagonist)
LDQGFSILEWIEGTTLDEVLAQGQGAEGAESIGAALAHIGQITFPEPGFFGPDLSIEVPLGNIVDGYLGYTLHKLRDPVVIGHMGRALVAETERYIARHRHLLEGERARSVLVHGDYKPSNLMVSFTPQGWRLAAVLDWEFAHAGHPLLDIGNLLRHEREMPPGFSEGFAKGFTSAGGTLGEDWREAARLVDLVNLVDFLSKPEPAPNRVADVLRLLNHTVERSAKVDG